MTDYEKKEFIDSLVRLIDDINIVVQKLFSTDYLAGKDDYDKLFAARDFAFKAFVKIMNGEE